MTTIAIEHTDWLMRLLSLQSKEEKLVIINRLSASLLKKKRRKSADMCFFDGLTNAWDDGTSVEEEVKRIH